MERFGEEEERVVNQVIRSGKLSQFFRDFRGGLNVQAFEREFANYLGSKHAISVTNGTVSLEIILKAFGIGKGDRVLTTPLSFIATATAILSVGAQPVFVDIEPDTLNIDPAKIEESIVSRTKAIFVVSLFGYPARMTALQTVAEDNKLLIIEDAAQALGASLCDKKIGTFGAAGSFSLQETKSITSLGEGGIIVTDNDKIADRARHIRNHGNVYGDCIQNVVCTNSRLTEAAAAFGRVQLKKLDHFNQLQIDNAEYFLKRLPENLRPVYSYPLPMEIKPTYLLIPAYAQTKEKRDKIVETLTKLGISKGIPGQNVGYYKRLIGEPELFQRRYHSRHSLRKCENAYYAKDHLILFDLHRWTKSRSTMNKALETVAALK